MASAPWVACLWSLASLQLYNFEVIVNDHLVMMSVAPTGWICTWGGLSLPGLCQPRCPCLELAYLCPLCGFVWIASLQ